MSQSSFPRPTWVWRNRSGVVPVSLWHLLLQVPSVSYRSSAHGQHEGSMYVMAASLVACRRHNPCVRRDASSFEIRTPVPLLLEAGPSTQLDSRLTGDRRNDESQIVMASRVPCSSKSGHTVDVRHAPAGLCIIPSRRSRLRACARHDRWLSSWRACPLKPFGGLEPMTVSVA